MNFKSWLPQYFLVNYPVYLIRKPHGLSPLLSGGAQYPISQTVMLASINCRLVIEERKRGVTHNGETANLGENNTQEEYSLLGNNAMQSVESQPTFRRNILPPSSGSKNKPGKIPASRGGMCL
jgi:hypothetical protein